MYEKPPGKDEDTNKKLKSKELLKNVNAITSHSVAAGMR